MDSTHDHFEKQQPPASGAFSDLQRLKSNGSATAAELREFLSQLDGRSPQEVMGIVAQSGLVRSTVTATIGCVVLLMVGTIVPYALSAGDPEASEQSAPVKTNVTQSPSAVADPTAATAASQESAASAEASNLERAAEAMGIDDAAPPDAKPLDTHLDKLLDGIE